MTFKLLTTREERKHAKCCSLLILSSRGPVGRSWTCRRAKHWARGRWSGQLPISRPDARVLIAPLTCRGYTFRVWNRCGVGP